MSGEIIKSGAAVPAAPVAPVTADANSAAEDMTVEGLAANLAAELGDDGGGEKESEGADAAAQPEEGDQIPVTEEATTDGEAPAEGEANPEGSETVEPTDGEDEGLPPEVQAKVDKRIGKEVGKRKAAEEERDDFKRRMIAAEAALTQEQHARPAGVATAEDPLADVADEKQLHNRWVAASSVVAEVPKMIESLAVPELFEEVSARLKKAGYDLGDEGHGSVLKVLQGIRDEATRTMAACGPKQQFFQKEKAFSQEARTLYPELSNPKSQMSLDCAELLKQAPFMKQLPNWEMALAAQCEGIKVIQARMAAKNAPPKPVAAKVPVVPSIKRGSSPASSPQAANLREAKERLAKSGSQEDLARVMALEG